MFLISVEIDLLHHIFQAQCDLAEWKFMPSLLHLHESKAKLLSWNKVLPASSVKDVSFQMAKTSREKLGRALRLWFAHQKSDRTFYTRELGYVLFTIRNKNGGKQCSHISTISIVYD